MFSILSPDAVLRNSAAPSSSSLLVFVFVWCGVWSYGCICSYMFVYIVIYRLTRLFWVSVGVEIIAFFFTVRWHVHGKRASAPIVKSSPRVFLATFLATLIEPPRGTDPGGGRARWERAGGLCSRKRHPARLAILAGFL